MEKNNQIINIISKPASLLFFAGFTPLFLALLSQYGFGLHPCELCVFQRIPFGIVIALGIIGIYFANNQKVFKAILALSILTFLFNAGLAFFHVGVEEKWWEYGECSGKFDMSSIEALKKSLFEAPNVRCDDVQFRFLGLSMAGWNIVYCILAALFFLQILRDKKR